MRTLVASALVLAACGTSDRRDSAAARDTPSAIASRGPDPVVLRIPRDGGLVRAYLYPRLDSVIWTSANRAAAPARVLAFDQEAGSIAYVDRAGLPGRIDLRLGSVGAASRAKLTSLTSADGWAIYGISNAGAVSRLTPSGNWSFSPPGRARVVLPLRDGALLVVAGSGAEATLLRVRPPDETISDSADVPRISEAAPLVVGDRVYFAVDSALVGVTSRNLSVVPPLRFASKVRAVAPTPSGDRIFVLTDGSRELAIVDRYRDAVSATVPLPASASDLRVDPLGRYLLVRPEVGDSVWVVAIGTGRFIGSSRTSWRPDLPFVGPDGSIALSAGNDVSFVEGETLRPRRAVPGGAADFWLVIRWNGFRPRAAELDEPVSFPTADTAPLIPMDTAATVFRPPGPTGMVPKRDTILLAPPRAPADTAVRQPPLRHGFIVSFAALLSEPRARDLAASINVDGKAARVVVSTASGAPVYRVVLGPYATRDEAERIGRESGRQFWVYEGIP